MIIEQRKEERRKILRLEERFTVFESPVRGEISVANGIDNKKESRRGWRIIKIQINEGNLRLET